MAATTKTANIALGWQYNKQSGAAIVANAKADLAAIAAASKADFETQLKNQTALKQSNAAYFSSARTEADNAYSLIIAKSNQAYDSAAQSAQASAAKQSAAIKTVIRDIGDLGNDIKALPDPDLGSITSGKAISNQQIGSRVAGLGSIVGQAGGGAAFRDVSQLIQLGSTAGAAGVGVGVLALGIRALSEAEQRGEETTKIATDSQKAYFQAIETGTTQSIQAARENAQVQLKVAQDLQAYYQRVLSDAGVAINQQLGVLAPLAKVGEALGLPGATGITKGYIDALAEANKEVSTQTALVGAYDRAIGDGNVALNDAVDAEKKRQEALVDSNKALIDLYDQEANTRTQLAQLRRTGSVDEVNAQLDANKDHETIIRQYLLPNVTKMGLTSAEASAKIIDLNHELGDLTEKDQLLLQAVLPVVAQREAEVDLLKAQKEASDALNDILQDINKTQVDLAEASQKVASALADQRQAEIDHSNNLIDIQAQYADAQMTALQKKNESFAKIDQQAASRALEQRENLNLQIEGLVGRGQIAEAQQAIRAQRLKEQQDTRQVQQSKDDATKSYNDQLKAADQQRDKLLKSEQERYLKERQQRQDAYTKAVQEQQALNNRLAQLRSEEAFQVQYNANVQVAALAKVSQATGGFANAMQTYADQINANNALRSGISGGSAGATYGNGLIGPAANATNQGYNYATGNYPSSFTGTPFNTPASMLLGNPVFGGFRASGGDVMAGKRYIVGESGVEMFVPRQSGTIVPNGGGNTLVFQVGEGGEALAAKIVAAVKPVLEQHGERVKVEVVQELTVRNNRVNKKGGAR